MKNLLLLLQLVVLFLLISSQTVVQAQTGYGQTGGDNADTWVINKDRTVSNYAALRLQASNTKAFFLANKGNTLNFSFSTADAINALNPNFNDEGTQLMTLTNNGKLGIGSAGSPFYQLEVSSGIDNYTGIKIANTTTNGRSWVLSSEAEGSPFGSGKFLIYDQTANLSRFAIDNVGNVGIGTFTPSAKLEVNGAGGESNDIVTNGRIWTGKGSTSGGIWVNSISGSPTQFFGTFNNTGKMGLFNNAWRLIVDSVGNVGIGTSTPSAKLEVAGQIKITGGTPGAGKVLTSDANGLATWATPTGGGTGGGTGGQWTTTGNNIYYYNDNGSTTGYVGIGTQSPAADLEVLSSDTVVTSIAIRNKSTQSGYNGGANYAIRVEGTGSPYTAGNFTILDRNVYPGTTAPKARLSITQNGDVGLGTVTPGARLEVNGQIKITGGAPGAGKVLTSDANGKAFWNTPTFSSQWMTSGTNISYSAGNVGIGTTTTTPEAKLHVSSPNLGENDGIKISQSTVNSLIYHNANKSLVLRKANQTDQLVLADDGKVGIGMDNPTEELDVNGDIHSNRVYVGNVTSASVLDSLEDSTGISYYLWVEKGVVAEDFAIAPKAEWDDYVFNENYELPTLEKVAAFVKENKHLPNIPSEAEVKAKGYSAHQLNRGFLKTIEELTLYTIEQDKKIKALEQKVANYEKLEAEVAQLKAQVQQFSNLEQRLKQLESKQ